LKCIERSPDQIKHSSYIRNLLDGKIIINNIINNINTNNNHNDKIYQIENIPKLIDIIESIKRKETCENNYCEKQIMDYRHNHIINKGYNIINK
jgi:hypothetical protein